MSKVVTLVVSGMPPKAIETDADTVQELLEEEGVEGTFAVRINKQAATMESSLDDGSYVVLGEKIKGA